jgi:hypothetical protein
MITSMIVIALIVFNYKRLVFFTTHRKVTLGMGIVLFVITIALNSFYYENKTIIIGVIYAIVKPIMYATVIYFILSFKKKKGKS